MLLYTLVIHWRFKTSTLKTQASLVAQLVKNLPAMQETWVQFLGQEDPLEKEMATHSSVLAWRIPGTGEPGGLPSMWMHRVGHDWSDLAAAAAASIQVFLPVLLGCLSFYCWIVRAFTFIRFKFFVNVYFEYIFFQYVPWLFIFL